MFAFLAWTIVYKKEIKKELAQYRQLINVEMTETDKELKEINGKLERFMLSTVQRLTRIETILYVAFGGNSIATIVLFILNPKK